MENNCRILTQEDCGSLVYQTSRIPYITGCNVPFHPNVMRSQTDYRILSTILQTHHTFGLVLDFYMVNSDFYCHQTVFLPFVEHQSFLRHIMEAQAIYLLESESLDSKHKNLTNFFRLLQNGQGFEITDPLRKTIEALHSIAPILQPTHLLSAPSLS